MNGLSRNTVLAFLGAALAALLLLGLASVFLADFFTQRPADQDLPPEQKNPHRFSLDRTPDGPAGPED